MIKKRSKEKFIEESNWIFFLQSNLVDHIKCIAINRYIRRHNNRLILWNRCFQFNFLVCACVVYLYQLISIFTKQKRQDKLMITKLLHKIKNDQKSKTKRQKCSTQFISLNLTKYRAKTILLNHLKLCPFGPFSRMLWTKLCF